MTSETGLGPPVRVLMDDQVFLMQARGGVSRYFVELMRQFSVGDFGVEVATPFRWSRNQHLVDLDPERFAVPQGRARNHPLWLRLANAIVAPRPGKIDVIHHTFYFRGRRAPASTPNVVTVYDMIPELLPEYFGTSKPHALKSDYVQHADAVICISEQTRQDLIAIYGDPGVPVLVTPLAVRPREAVEQAVVKPGPPFVLFVGSRALYKNFEVVLEAMMSPELAGVDLHCAGGGRFSAAERTAIDERGLGARVHQQDASEAELQSLYSSAIAFVFPSRYEGFGLPVLEALEAECPAVLADTPVFHEVAGPAALYFPPDDSDELVRILTKLLHDRGCRQQIIQAGKERARVFTWERTARETAAVYRMVAR